MEILTRETAEGDTEYFFLDTENRHETDIRNIIYEEIVNDCQWLDEEHKFIQVDYYDWENNELIALMNSSGQLMRKGISEIVEYIQEHGLFIIMQLGDNLGDDRFDYMAEEEDHLYAVINSAGEYIIEPQPFAIEYNDYESVFEINQEGELMKFDLMGNKVGE